jgi:hypothetical protein
MITLRTREAKMRKSRTDERKVINIVSGLPRSGTSMMMKMLQAGGIEPLIDNIRKADEDNPKGYFEFERVKQIKEDISWLDHAEGKVVKMVSMLLLDLPSDRRYRIVFMRREMREVLASQRKMEERKGMKVKKGAEAEAEDRMMAALYRKHLVKVHNFLEKADNIDLLYVRYNDILDDPQPVIEEVNRFFGGDLDVEKMAEVVDPSLYRQRKGALQ